MVSKSDEDFRRLWEVERRGEKAVAGQLILDSGNSASVEACV